MDGENTRIRVYQAGLDNISTNFQKEIESGQGECCHWSNSDCNKSRTPDSPVHFHVQIGFKGINIKNSGIYLASCYAGGALELGGHDYHSLTATCYGPSGQYRNKTLSITDISKVDLSLSYLAH
ncbi:hypothetical protein BD770DRAFT_442455 [Pilaira anomala]|nr:hypothetical protein BD770DRAFT_442455 [Pilaira anomala]